VYDDTSTTRSQHLFYFVVITPGRSIAVWGELILSQSSVLAPPRDTRRHLLTASGDVLLHVLPGSGTTFSARHRREPLSIRG
jgi:hypothetical protein